MPKTSPRRLTRFRRDDDVQAVVDETIALFHHLAYAAEQIYGPEGRGTARRRLLRSLLRYGPRTVPAIARARSLRRQTIQPVVDALAAEGLVELVDNPEHASSRLVRITAKGERIVAHLDRTDRALLAVIGEGIPRVDIVTTARTLRLFRTRFEETRGGTAPAP